MRIEIWFWQYFEVAILLFQRSNSENEDWNSPTWSRQLSTLSFQRSNSENEDWNRRSFSISRGISPVSKVKLRKWGLKCWQSRAFEHLFYLVSKVKLRKWGLKFQGKNLTYEEVAVSKVKLRKWGLKSVFPWVEFPFSFTFQRSNSENEMIWKTTFIGIVIGGEYRLGPFSILAHT